VDAKIRAASNGRRKLDDVMLPLFERRRRGETLTIDKLLAALAEDLGPSIRERFEAVLIRGETIVPDPNAFGTCFERRATTFTNQGQQMDGYEWVRKSGTSDQQCREW
jgi:predicted metalloprotease with PDZ domain